MKVKIIIVITLLFKTKIFMQTIDYSQNWKEELLNDEFFNTIKVEEFLNLDLSPAISNDDTGSKYYALRSYTGVFGSNYYRIDFFFKVKKDENDNTIYHAVGKSKFKSNIRPINGEMKLVAVRRQSVWPRWKNPYLCIFEYNFKEPGTKPGDGQFEGIASILVGFEDDSVSCFLTDGPDFKEYTNVFVGIWKKYNSDSIIKCIFSYDVVDLYFKLPFCDDLYILPDPEIEHEYELNKKYFPYGWSDYYSDNNNRDVWWK